MNARVDPILSVVRPLPRVPSLESDSPREGRLELTGEFSLHHGGTLRDAVIAWRCVGPAQAPVVLALGGISADRHVCESPGPVRGWWGEVAGRGQALDTERVRIVSFDYLGGSGESSGPGRGERFPSLSTYDQAEVLARLLDHLGLAAVHAVIGASYGGMVALAFGERYPERVRQLLVIGAAERAHPMAIAWRSIQREIVRLGLSHGTADASLALARALALTTYRSPEEFAARFTGAPSREEEGFVFPVQPYLRARGRAYAAHHRPEAFLCLSESLDLHWVDAARICVPTRAVAVREDQLVPLSDVRALVARLPAGRLHEISSLYGHDAFLKEPDQLRSIFASALGRLA